MNAHKAIAGWLVLVGLAMLAAWTMLFLGSGTGIQHPSFVWHLAAEGITAVFAVVTGIAFFGRHRWAMPGLFVGLGAVTAASGGAAGWYFTTGDTASAGALGFLALLTVGFSILGSWLDDAHPLLDREIVVKTSRITKTFHYSIGLSMYAVLNGASQYGAAGNRTMALIHVVGFGLLAYFEAVLLRRSGGPA